MQICSNMPDQFVSVDIGDNIKLFNSESDCQRDYGGYFELIIE